MRILGVDCGSRRTGYGVIETDGAEHRIIAAGVIRTTPARPFEERLLEIAEGLRRLIREHAPEAVAVEEVFCSVNVKSALKLAHVRGAALLVIAETGLDVAEYSPLEIKRSVVGYGRAEKRQVQMMVQSLLRLPEGVESEDASDALAAAICHATHAGAARRASV
ncbi:MAG: crossover junction endodeoxyribonuclease RuvC [Bryobacteraceae bacterium]